MTIVWVVSSTSLARKTRPNAGLRAEQGEEIGADILHAVLPGFTCAGQRRLLGGTGYGKVFENVVLLFPVHGFGDGRSTARAGPAGHGLEDHHEAVGMVVSPAAHPYRKKIVAPNTR